MGTDEGAAGMVDGREKEEETTGVWRQQARESVCGHQTTRHQEPTATDSRLRLLPLFLSFQPSGPICSHRSSHRTQPSPQAIAPISVCTMPVELSEAIALQLTALACSRADCLRHLLFAQLSLAM